MDEILLLLLRKGANRKPLRMTGGEIGFLTGMSQQNASKKLRELAAGGYIERGKEGIMLTGKAMDGLGSLYSSLRVAFEGGRVEIEGTIAKGLGEGGFYMGLEGYRRQFRKSLGFEPYPGTLNIRIDEGERWKRQHMLSGDAITISGFRDKERSFGDLFAYRCELEGRSCAIIVPLRTHHGPDIIELVCPFNAKKELGRKEGDRVAVRI